MLTDNLLVSTLICFIPMIALYLVVFLLVKGFNWWKGLLCMASGFICLAPIAFFQNLFDKFPIISAETTGGILLSALVLNGLIEELVKTILLTLTPVPVKSPFGAFIRGLLTGMSLGCFEVFIYLITGTESQLLRLASIWGIHVCCTILCSYFVWSIFNKKFYIAPFLFAVVFHGIYSYFAGYYTFMKYFCAAVIAIAALECRIRYTIMTQPVPPLDALDETKKA